MYRIKVDIPFEGSMLEIEIEARLYCDNDHYIECEEWFVSVAPDGLELNDEQVMYVDKAVDGYIEDNHARIEEDAISSRLDASYEAWKDGTWD